jgi:uncharacterized membrane protein YadS
MAGPGAAGATAADAAAASAAARRRRNIIVAVVVVVLIIIIAIFVLPKLFHTYSGGLGPLPGRLVRAQLIQIGRT